MDKRKNEQKVKCHRCKIEMTPLFERSYGAIGTIYECPKCKGLLQK